MFKTQTLSADDRLLLEDDTFDRSDFLAAIAEDRGLIDYEVTFCDGRWGVQRYRAAFEEELSFSEPARGRGFYETALGSSVELDAQGRATGRALAGFRELESYSPDASCEDLWHSAA